MEYQLQWPQRERCTEETEGGRFLQGDYSDTERQNGYNPPHPRKCRQFLKGPDGFSQGLPVAQAQSAIGRSKADGWPHPEQRVEKLVDGDVIELALLCPTHSGTFGEDYDHVLWSFLQDLGQALWGSTSGGRIACA